MNVLMDAIPYVPELPQSKDSGLQAALEVRFSSDVGNNLIVAMCHGARTCPDKAS